MSKFKINKKKFVGSTIIVLFILTLLVIMLLYFYCKDEKYVAKKQLEYINSDKWNGELYPEGMPNLFRNYSGALTCQNIGKSFYYVTNTVIPNYAIELKQLNDLELEEYFNQNKNTIALDVGIRKKEEFLKFINKIKEIVKTDQIEFEEFYIDDSTVKKQSGVTKANLCIKYKNCEELVVNIRINNNKISNISAVRYE